MLADIFNAGPVVFIELLFYISIECVSRFIQRKGTYHQEWNFVIQEWKEIRFHGAIQLALKRVAMILYYIYEKQNILISSNAKQLE